MKYITAIIMAFLILVAGQLLIKTCPEKSNEISKSQAMKSRESLSENVAVYMSDIDGLVKAVMLYGVTNGITYNGTNYMFVVEPKED